MTSLNYSVWLSRARQANVNLSKRHKFNIICATPGFDLTEQNSDFAELGSTYMCRAKALSLKSLKSIFFLSELKQIFQAQLSDFA